MQRHPIDFQAGAKKRVQKVCYHAYRYILNSRLFLEPGTLIIWQLQKNPKFFLELSVEIKNRDLQVISEPVPFNSVSHFCLKEKDKRVPNY